MKFYDILEPQQDLAIGIDLGTTNSLVAVKSGDTVQILPDDKGVKLLPSAVLYKADGEVVIGAEAMGQQGSIATVKRLMGRGIEDIDSANWNLHAKSDAQNVFLDINQNPVSPVEISAEILKALKRRAEAYLECPVHKAVITVPAYFDDASRNATRMAAQLAGLEVLRLINEPTAAAVAYGLEKKENGIFLVYDLGGGTFDVSILEKQDDVLQVIATAGDINLGGYDFDLALFSLLKKRHGIAGDCDETNIAAVCAIREQLSTLQEVQCCFLGREICVTRQQFEESITHSLERTLKLVQKTMSDAALKVADIQEIILVGGATRTPIIKHMLHELFGMKVLDHINPDEIVAVGAAMQADMIMNQSGALLLDVIPLSLGLELMGGVVERIIPRNSSIPISVTKIFTNHSAEQTGVKMHIVQGESDQAEYCRSLGMLELKELPKMQPGSARISVTFRVDADGVLTVEAQEQESRARQEVILKPTYGLDEETMLQLLNM